MSEVFILRIQLLLKTPPITPMFSLKVESLIFKLPTYSTSMLLNFIFIEFINIKKISRVLVCFSYLVHFAYKYILGF